MEWILLLGVVTGCRTMTGIAVVCWAAWLGALPEHGWAIWITYLVSALIFTGFAIGEYIGDTLPQDAQPQGRGTCSGSHRLGALVGALAATAIYEPVAGGILLGAVGAVIGTWEATHSERLRPGGLETICPLPSLNQRWPWHLPFSPCGACTWVLCLT